MYLDEFFAEVLEDRGLAFVLEGELAAGQPPGLAVHLYLYGRGGWVGGWLDEWVGGWINELPLR